MTLSDATWHRLCRRRPHLSGTAHSPKSLCTSSTDDVELMSIPVSLAGGLPGWYWPAPKTTFWPRVYALASTAEAA